MGKVARNALKGYTFQHYIFTLFLAKMDSDRAIKKIESEAVTDGNFDDLYIEANENYRIQVKNYPNTKLDDIVITGDCVRINGLPAFMLTKELLELQQNTVKASIE